MSDSPKIFTTHLREMTARFDPRYHDPVFSDNLRHIQQVHWCALRQCCELSEETWDKGVLFPDQFPYIEISAIDTESGMVSSVGNYVTEEAPSRAQLVVRSGDILVSMTRPTRNAIAKVPDAIDVAIASTGFSVVRAVDTRMVSTDYLFHVLRLGFCTMQFDQRSSGGNYPAITKADLLNTIIPVPPLDVQNRIVAELDAAYEAKRKADEKAAQLLASIDDIVLSELGIPKLPPQDTSLKARMFVVSSRDLSGGRFDASCLKPYFRWNVARISSCKYTDLRSLITLSHEMWAQKEWAHGNTFPYLEIAAIETATGEVRELSKLPISEAPSRARMIVHANDLLVSLTRPTRGAITLVPNGVEDFIASTGFAVMRDIDSAVDIEYLLAVLRSELCTLQFDARSSGGNYPAITEEQLLECVIPVPHREVQQKIVQKVAAVYAKVKLFRYAAAKALVEAKINIERQII